MKFLFLQLIVVLIFLDASSCAPNSKTNVIPVDSIPKIDGVSEHAELINLGFEDMPVYAWAEYVGSFSFGKQTYSHIKGIRYTYVATKISDTIYYENFSIRNSTQNIDFGKANIKVFPGNATIQITGVNDTLYLFHVLADSKFKTNYKGVEFISLPCIHKSPYDDFPVSDEDLGININRVASSSIFEVTIFGEGPVITTKYRLSPSAGECLCIPSFFDKRDGRIYFIGQKCYLEPININDVKSMIK